MEKRKVLFISQEMMPYMANENEITRMSRMVPQGVQEQGFEIRTFMPRFGCINERRHQLHEVIRLSGMNIVVNDSDQPLIIKVASIPTARMQVYFIDNEEYFQRKSTLVDDAGKFHADNDERAIFYIKGVFETVKKLGWAPDVIHCHGWMASLVSVYLKNVYKNDPIFSGAKVVMSLYNSDEFQGELNAEFGKKVLKDEMTTEHYKVTKPTYANVMNEGIRYADAVVIGNEKINKDIEKYLKASDVKKVNFNPEEDYVGPMLTLYNELIEDSVLA
jgi:starch synthase